MNPPRKVVEVKLESGMPFAKTSAWLLPTHHNPPDSL